MRARPMSSMQPVDWKTICDMFAPFEGSCLYAIRADAYFHLALAQSAPVKFAAKNRLYPPFAWWRAARAQHASGLGYAGQSRYLFVCDYAAEPGFGTLRPVLEKLGSDSLLIGLDPVIRSRSSELEHMGIAAINLDVEVFAQAKGRLRRLWRTARKDCNRLIESCPKENQSLLLAARSVLQTLLVRAYLYREFYDRVFEQNSAPQAVIAHNDFTTCSYLACVAAREAGASSFTLQHGFPTAEYFPTSADHYLVWGPRFRDFMMSRPGIRSNVMVAGAPRFDELAKATKSGAMTWPRREESRVQQTGRCDVVFFSQSHSPLFSEDEHRLVLAALTPLLEDHRFNVVVRLHPQESERRFRRISGFERITIAPPDLSLQETLSSADVAISCNSTAMLEAMAIEVPVVQIAPQQVRDRLGIIEPCSVARNGEELMRCLETLMTVNSRRTFTEKQNELLQQYLTNFPAAADAVCAAIEEELGCGLSVVEAEA